MKQTIVLILICLSFCGIHAQDTIVKLNGDKIIVMVKEVTPGTVRYKYYSNPGRMFIISKADIISVNYHNGDIQVFNNKPVITTPAEPDIILGKEGYGLTDDELYRKGLSDAAKYYEKYSGAGTGTLLTSLLLNGLFGLVPAIACSSTPPKMKNLGYPSQTLIDNDAYYKGYSEGAHKKKSKKVWMNWAVGTVISTSILILAATAN